MKRTLTFLAVLMLGACDPPPEVMRVEYLKDSRVGLCFAYSPYSRGATGEGRARDLLVPVPCSPEINRLAKEVGR